MNTEPIPRDIILLSLGPVQSFIETARRTQDLTVGSQLLSLLAGAAVEAAVNNQAEEIFPRRIAGRWPTSIPNRVVVMAQAGNGARVANAMAKAAQIKWNGNGGVACLTRDEFRSLAGSESWETRWDQQTAEWLEVYWVAWPWDGNPQTYHDAYRYANLALEARKSVRHFPVAQQPGEKCILCGVRSALGTEEGLWKRVRSRVSPSQLRPGERLCAVCACKRFASRCVPELKMERFPSTSSIASASFRAALLEPVGWQQVSAEVNAHLNAVDALGLHAFPDIEPSEYLQRLADQPDKQRLLRYDGDYFYREFFAGAQVKDALGVTELSSRQLEALVHASNTLSALLKKAKDAGIQSPSPYFATLALDGDRMGELLDQAQDLTAHQAISDVLATLAEGPMKDITQVGNPGQLIYAGGDDALALLPVDCALQAADKLRFAFEDALNSAGNPGRSASIGVAIVHHLHPLDGAIRAAREAEHAAKDERKYNRKALAVECLRRSGEQRQVGRKWGSADCDPIDEGWINKSQLRDDYAKSVIDLSLITPEGSGRTG